MAEKRSWLKIRAEYFYRRFVVRWDSNFAESSEPANTFEVSTTDGGPAGSGQDTILVQFYGPNSFTYNAPATIAGGDVVVHE
jgi:hypothetical protein